jgi:hypothetical protein
MTDSGTYPEISRDDFSRDLLHPGPGTKSDLREALEYALWSLDNGPAYGCDIADLVNRLLVWMAPA